MIDTLRLNLTDCEIKRSCPLTIQPGLIDHSSGQTFNESDLFIDNTGKIITGSKAYLNHEKFNLTIQPTIQPEMTEYNRSKLKIKRFKRIDEKIQKDLWDWESENDEVKGIFIQTSLPRLLSETNLKTLSYDEQKTALKTLETELKNNGIKTNIFNANLSRVDTFTNLKTDFPFYSYSNLFSLMECSRMKSIGYADESFLWKNGNQQLAIYDKILEMKTKKPELNFASSKNIMRIENRLLKKRAIDAKLHFIKLDDIYKNYDELKDYHRRETEKKIFKYSFSEIRGLTENKLEAQLIFCKKQFKDKWLDGFLKMEGIKAFLGSDNENFLLDMIDKLDSEKKEITIRVKKSRAKKLYQEMKFYISMFEMDFKKDKFKSNAELYNELKSKFYKEVA
jgi:hypothetical protein